MCRSSNASKTRRNTSSFLVALDSHARGCRRSPRGFVAVPEAYVHGSRPSFTTQREEAEAAAPAGPVGLFRQKRAESFLVGLLADALVLLVGCVERNEFLAQKESDEQLSTGARRQPSQQKCPGPIEHREKKN